MALQKKCTPLQVFSNDFAQVFSYLSRFLSFSEASISQNTFQFAAYNCSNKLSEHYLHKFYIFGVVTMS